MLEIRSTVKLDDIESVMKAVAHRHNANVTVVSHLGQPHHVHADGGPR
jgi:ketopantoate hydroxymethyltransferase